MKNTRSVRIAIGTVCLIAIALVMGWFVGRYIPGAPHEPEPRIGDGLYSETGYAASKIMDLAPGSTLKARGITQGKAYNGRPEEIEQAIPPEIEEAWKEAGEWEYDAPDFDLSVRGIKVISTKSFADWYPEYAGTDYPAYDSSKLVAATVLVTNVSSEAIDLQRDFPLHNFSLWGENLDYIDDSLGAGANRTARTSSRTRSTGRSKTQSNPANRSRSSCRSRSTRTPSRTRARSTTSTRPTSACNWLISTPEPPIACGCNPFQVRIFAPKTRHSCCGVFWERRCSLRTSSHTALSHLFAP